MSEANVIFIFMGNNMVIQCMKKEKMRDICKRYSSKIERHINTLLFLYNGNLINLELSFEEQANIIDKNNRKMNILVDIKESSEFICPKCGGKIELNREKLDEIILLNNNIKDKINGLKMNLENIIEKSMIDIINNQLKNITIILNSINEDINKNNIKLKNILNDDIINISNNKNKNVIRGILDINSNEINNAIILFNYENNDDIDVFINNEKIITIKDNNKKKYKFENEGKYSFEIIFNNIINNLKKFFEQCSKVISLDFTDFDSSNITDISFMFNECHKLKEIKGMDKFNTSKVIDMNTMFQKCYELEYLDLTNFNSHIVTNMSFMFSKCNKLKEIKGINKLNTSKVIDMKAMFQQCSVVEYLDLSNFNTDNVNNMSYMFNECHKLKEIKGINNFNTSKVTDMSRMFQACDIIEYLDLSNFNTANVTNMYHMFKKCINLKYLNLLNFSINCNTENMFSFIAKKNCQFITNNKDLMDLYNSS